MSLFGALDISSSGVSAMQTWIDANAGNIANAEDAVSPGETPYEEEVANFNPSSLDGGELTGVSASVSALPSAGITVTDDEGQAMDKDGEVVLPDISLGDQLAGLVQAQDGYEADTSALSRALTAYQAGLEIGS